MGYFSHVNKCQVREVYVSFNGNKKSHERNYRRVHKLPNIWIVDLQHTRGQLMPNLVKTRLKSLIYCI